MSKEQEHKFFIHESSFLDEKVIVGMNTRIWHFCHIMSGAHIGENCILGQNTFVGAKVHIGNGVKIQNNVSIYEGVQLEDDVFVGPSVVFTNVKTPRSFIERKNEFAPTRIRKGASLGANATIICGTTIGKYALVAAGSVVTKNVADYALVMGVPAEQTGWVCKCGEALTFENNKARCSSCNTSYVMNEDATQINPINA